MHSDVKSVPRAFFQVSLFWALEGKQNVNWLSDFVWILKKRHFPGMPVWSLVVLHIFVILGYKSLTKFENPGDSWTRLLTEWSEAKAVHVIQNLLAKVSHFPRWYANVHRHRPLHLSSLADGGNVVDDRDQKWWTRFSNFLCQNPNMASQLIRRQMIGPFDPCDHRAS